MLSPLPSKETMPESPTTSEENNVDSGDEESNEIVFGNQDESPPEVPTQIATQMQGSTQEQVPFGMLPFGTPPSQQSYAPFAPPFPLAQSQISRLTMSQSQPGDMGPPTAPPRARLPSFSATQESYATCGFGAIEQMLAAQQAAAQAPFVPYIASNTDSTKKPKATANPNKKTKNKKVKPQEMPRKERGNMYDDEVLCLLDTIEELCPCGPEGWKAVEKQHMKNGWPESRKAANLRKKWVTLQKDALRYKTGDPDITEIQQRSREVSYKLKGSIRARDPSIEGGELKSLLHRSSLVNLENIDNEDISISATDTDTTGSFKRKKKPISLDGDMPMINQGSRSVATFATMQSQSSVLESLAQAQIEHMRNEREARKEEREARRSHDTMFLKLAALGAMAFMGQGEDMKDTVKEIFTSIIKGDEKKEKKKDGDTSGKPVDSIEVIKEAPVPNKNTDTQQSIDVQDDDSDDDSLDRLLDANKRQRI